jgi:hypothetical protein
MSAAVAPLILEDDLLFAVCGNTVKVFSLRTGFCIKTLRQGPKEIGQAISDVHRADILFMGLFREKLVTVCGRGTFAEWDARS